MRVVSMDQETKQIVVELSRDDLSHIHNAMWDLLNEGLITGQGQVLLDRFWEILRSFDEPMANHTSGV